MKPTILTGDRPTGKLHLGHFVGSLKNRVAMQDTHDQYVMLADVQALTDNADNPQKIRDNVREVLLDYLAVGIDPSKTTIFIQSQIPEIAELTVFFMNLVSLSRLELNPTVKDEMRQKGFGTSVPLGFVAYPVSQAADILAFKANVVPVGADQAPMIEQTNEIAEKFNRYYGETFPRVNILVGDQGRLVGTDGAAKMSKSLNNCIYLSDSAEDVAKKVMGMYTDPNHLRVEDPGQVEGNAVFAYLDIFDEDKAGVDELKAQYRAGGLGDVVVKKRLQEVLERFLSPIRARREEFAKDEKALDAILKDGTAKARAKAEQTMAKVRKSMKIDYFS